MEWAMENPLIISFLKNENMKALYLDYLNNPDEFTKEIIEYHFSQYCRKIQILSYFSKTLHFDAQRFDMKIRDHSEKYPLILNQDNGFEDILVRENVEDDKVINYDEYAADSYENIGEIISNKQLYMIVDNLKPKNKELLYLLYVKGLEEKEVAKMLGLTIQAVNKRKNTILKQIKQRFNG